MGSIFSSKQEDESLVMDLEDPSDTSDTSVTTDQVLVNLAMDPSSLLTYIDVDMNNFH